MSLPGRDAIFRAFVEGLISGIVLGFAVGGAFILYLTK